MHTRWISLSGTQIFCENDSDSSHWSWLDSSHSVKNVTRVELPFFSMWLESSPSHQKSWLESSHWLESRYHRHMVLCWKLVELFYVAAIIRYKKENCEIALDFQLTTYDIMHCQWCKMATFNISPHRLSVVLQINLFADNASFTSLIRSFLTVSADFSTFLFTVFLSGRTDLHHKSMLCINLN